MATIVTIASGDLISNSRADLNTNFSNLNSDKIETSALDTDTSLAANSDAKIATQKAVKAYVDTGGNSNASTTVRGIVEEATEAEAAAGTAAGATGARLFVNPSTLPNPTRVSLPAGQDLTAGDAVFAGGVNLVSNTPAIGASNGFGRAAAATQEKCAQSINESGALGGVMVITVRLGKTGSPTDNAVIQIQSDSAGSPSGSVLASGSVAAASITTTASDVTITLDTAVNFSAGTTYWLVFTRSGSGDSTNYYQAGGSVSTSYANGSAKYYSSSAWTGTVDAADLYFIVKNTAGSVFKTSAAVSATCAGFLGFVASTVSSGSTAAVITSGQVTGLSGLTAGSSYYLSNTAGAIATSAGTVTRKAGIATSTTTLVVTNIW